MFSRGVASIQAEVVHGYEGRSLQLSLIRKDRYRNHLYSLFSPFTLAQNCTPGASYNVSVSLSIVLTLQSREMNHKMILYLGSCNGDEKQLNLLRLLIRLINNQGYLLILYRYLHAEKKKTIGN